MHSRIKIPLLEALTILEARNTYTMTVVIKIYATNSRHLNLLKRK